jgi:DHA2 family multidrug resistance protein-like MFS transporter
MANNVGWRWIFILCAAASVLGLLMVRGTPESKVHGTSGSSGYQLDIKGIATFMVAMVALQVLVTLGGTLGWTSIASVVLLATAVIVGFLFVRVESGNPNAFVDFRLFKNRTYAGATLSNLLLNAVAGIIIVAMTLVQVGGGLSAQEAGFLTLGYAVSIVVFIRVGERLLQRFGARLPMIRGCLIVAAAIVLLMPTNLVLGSYRILAFVAFTLFGVGLGFYATPSTDAAISNLPDDQAGSGSGIYKMASSLGASFGVAISAAIFTALSADQGGVDWLPGVLSFAGRQDNVAERGAALLAFGANLLMIVAAIVAIMLFVPKGKAREDPERSTPEQRATPAGARAKT